MPDSKHRQYPAVTVDVVLIACLEGRFQVLLIRRNRPPFEGYWAIPGGFVNPGETLEVAARRELKEETGAELAHGYRLEQLYTFGDPGRDPRGWTISVVYMAYLAEEEVQTWHLQADSDASDVKWFELGALPHLAFDHADILACAVRRLELGAGLPRPYCPRAEFP